MAKAYTFHTQLEAKVKGSELYLKYNIKNLLLHNDIPI